MPRHQFDIVHRISHMTFVHSEKFYLLAMLVCLGIGVLIASSGLLAFSVVTPPIFIGLALAIVTVVGSFTKVYSALGKSMWECSCSQLEEIESAPVFDLAMHLLLIASVCACAYSAVPWLQKSLGREVAISFSLASAFIGAGFVFFLAYRTDLVGIFVSKLPKDEFLSLHDKDLDEEPDYDSRLDYDCPEHVKTIHLRLNQELADEKKLAQKKDDDS